MSTQHTSGPLVAIKCDNGIEWDVVKPEPGLEAAPWFVATCHDGPADGSAEANARLFAAAPMLLLAAQQAIATLAASRRLIAKHVPDHHWLPEHDKRIAELKAAIAVAKHSRSGAAA